MIYEIRMTVIHTYAKLKPFANVTKNIKTTLIEYTDAVGVDEAFNKAAKRKHEIIIELAKNEGKLWEEDAWGPRSTNISISLDAVVAKPELSLKQIDETIAKKRTYEYNWLVSLLEQANIWLSNRGCPHSATKKKIIDQAPIQTTDKDQALIRIKRVIEIIGEVQSGIALLDVKQ